MDYPVTKIKGGKIIGLVKTEEPAPVEEPKIETESAPPKKRTKKATTESGK